MTEPRRTTGGPGAAAPSAAPRALRPVDLGRALGLSAQMARRYEQWGFLPPARSLTGRRCYTPRHLHAMLAARAMQAGYGRKTALRVMRLLHAGDVPGPPAG